MVQRIHRVGPLTACVLNVGYTAILVRGDISSVGELTKMCKQDASNSRYTRVLLSCKSPRVSKTSKTRNEEQMSSRKIGATSVFMAMCISTNGYLVSSSSEMINNNSVATGPIAYGYNIFSSVRKSILVST